MSHARPHLETHSRAKGHSAVAGVAYRLGLRLYDRRTGTWHDYRKRALGEEIVRALTIAPEGAPPWATDPDELWNRVEAAERRKDSQVARDYRIPIPFGLTDAQAGGLAEAMARFISAELGTAVSMGLHRDADVDALGQVKPPDRQGFHAHLYFPTRRIDCSGSAGEGEGAGMGEKLAVLSNKRTSADVVERLNAHWAALANEYTEAAGLVADYDHRSYERMGLPIVPQPTLGAPAVALERSGFFTRKGDAAREIIVMSEVYKKVHGAALEAQHAQAVADMAKASEATSAETISSDTPASNGDRATSISAADSGSLAVRFRSSVGPGATTEEQSRHQEALSWVRVIQIALRVLDRIAKTLLRFASERERERASMMEMEYQVDMSRAQRADAHHRLKRWEADHPWRMAAAKALGSSNQMPEAWRRLKGEARTHHDEVQTLKAVMHGHQVALNALADQEAPLLVQRTVQEGRMKSAVAALVALDAGYPAQLLAVCREGERTRVVSVLPEAFAGEPEKVPKEEPLASPEPRPSFLRSVP